VARDDDVVQLHPIMYVADVPVGSPIDSNAAKQLAAAIGDGPKPRSVAASTLGSGR
jgi:hypothetical protein